MASFFSDTVTSLWPLLAILLCHFPPFGQQGMTHLEYLQCTDSKPCVCVCVLFERSKEDDVIVEVSYYEMKVDLFIAVHEWLVIL